MEACGGGLLCGQLAVEQAGKNEGEERGLQVRSHWRLSLGLGGGDGRSWRVGRSPGTEYVRFGHGGQLKKGGNWPYGLRCD